MLHHGSFHFFLLYQIGQYDTCHDHCSPTHQHTIIGLRLLFERIHPCVHDCPPVRIPITGKKGRPWKKEAEKTDKKSTS